MREEEEKNNNRQETVKWRMSTLFR